MDQGLPSASVHIIDHLNLGLLLLYNDIAILVLVYLKGTLNRGGEHCSAQCEDSSII